MADRTPLTLASRGDVQHVLGVRRALTTAPESRLGPGVGSPDPAVSVRRLELLVSGSPPIPCLVLTPSTTPPPWPGVVAIHQHDGTFDLGKSEPAGLAGDPSMAYGLALARAGALVVVPDLAGFEDRLTEGVPADAGPDPARLEQLRAQRLLVEGSTLQARHVEDVALCVSWLGQQTDVTAGIGLVGHSLGGQVAFFSAACDERVRAVVISCGVGTVASFHAAGILHNPAWYVPGLLAAGDTPAVAAVARDQAFWVVAGEADPLFPLEGVRAAVAALPRGVGALRVVPGGHALPADAAAQATAWLMAAIRGRVP
ncbi:MAG TPA: alpha/beta fold hydrolase [Actinotalea sp.]